MPRCMRRNIIPKLKEEGSATPDQVEHHQDDDLQPGHVDREEHQVDGGHADRLISHISYFVISASHLVWQLPLSTTFFHFVK